MSQVTATLMKRAMLMNQKLGDKGAGALILSADIDSRRASVLPQALQDKVTTSRCIVLLAHTLPPPPPPPSG